MPKVWTRKRAGTDPSQPRSTRSSTETAAPRIRNPVPDRSQIHQIELPLSWTGVSAPKESTLVYLVEGDPLTLIDTGVRSAESRAALELALEALGYGFSEIERVVVTHSHRDHFGLVRTLRAAGAELECCVHEDDADLVEGFSERNRERVDGQAALFREYGVPEPVLTTLHEDRVRGLSVDDAEAEGTTVERRLAEGDQLEWKDWQLGVLHSPGHTPGHILLEDRLGGILFTGDQIMGQAVPYADNFYLEDAPDPADPLHRRPRFRGLVEMRRSLRRLRDRRYALLLPGYGGTISRADRAIRDTLLYYEVRLQRIDRGLRQLAAMGQDVTAFDIWKALYPSDGLSEDRLEEVRAQLLLVIGALDCLEDDRLLLTERNADGILTHYHC